MKDSPYKLVKQVEVEVGRVFAKANIRSKERRIRELASSLQIEMADARTYSRDYELSESPEEQAENSAFAIKWLESSRNRILKLSEFGIFDAVEVAHLTAQIDQGIANLK